MRVKEITTKVTYQLSGKKSKVSGGGGGGRFGVWQEKGR